MRFLQRKQLLKTKTWTPNGMRSLISPLRTQNLKPWRFLSTIGNRCVSLCIFLRLTTCASEVFPTMSGSWMDEWFKIVDDWTIQVSCMRNSLLLHGLSFLSFGFPTLMIEELHVSFSLGWQTRQDGYECHSIERSDTGWAKGYDSWSAKKYGSKWCSK